MTADRRFKDRGTILAEFWDRILVVCPDGSGAALIKGEATWRPKHATLISLNSAFRLQFPSEDWFGPVVGTFQRFCPMCSIQIDKRPITREKLGEKPKTHVTWRCRCGHEVSRPIKWARLEFSNRAIDPYFGLPLWLKTEVAGEVLWAYNSDHLDYLENYVSAKVRETGSSIHRSLASRLPTWMKLAANRPKLLRGIDRLRKKIIV